MKAVGISDIGKCRKNNEDAFYVSKEDTHLPHLYIVADGMGGCNAGEVASSSAIAAFLEYTKKVEKEEPVDMLTGGVQAANLAVFDKSNSAKEFAEMGTTIVVAAVEPEKIYIAYVGDSRAYLWKDSQLSLLTTDHSYVMELVKLGTITREEAASHPKRNIITRAVGIRDTVEVDTVAHSVKEGDILLLCTDGLSGMLTDREIERILQEATPIEEKAARLVEEANGHGGHDNISLILVEL